MMIEDLSTAIANRDEMIATLEEKCAVLSEWNLELRRRVASRAKFLEVLGGALHCDCCWHSTNRSDDE